MKTLTLPKSGLTLEPGELRYTVGSDEVGCIAQISAYEGGEWEAWVLHEPDTLTGSFEACCAWVDDALVALRKALTPEETQ